VHDSSVFVLFGPGGAGKGTVAARLVERDPRLWLSRSWTTRARRQGEADDAYVFVDRAAFESKASAGGFLEWAEYLGNLYGTPVGGAPAGRDLFLEIDLQGAEQVRGLRPDATLILLEPPSQEVQAERLRARGDDESHIAERLRAGAEELRRGKSIAHAVVVNHDIDQATDEVAGIVERFRAAPHGDGGRSDPSPDVAEGS
jgi:guanylate kinase